MFAWKTVEVTKTYIPREKRRIAAVAIDTNQIAQIYESCNAAARAIIVAEYGIFNPSEKLVQDCAAEIAKAAAQYHKEILGYYWKWI